MATKEKVVPEKTEVDEIVEESEAHLKEILSKYRDRAAERRKGGEQEDLDEADIRMKLAGGFKVSHLCGFSSCLNSFYRT